MPGHCHIERPDLIYFIVQIVYTISLNSKQKNFFSTKREKFDGHRFRGVFAIKWADWKCTECFHVLSLATIIVSYSESPGGNSSLMILASGTVTNTSVCASWRGLFIKSSPVSLFLKSCSQLMIISNLFPRSESKDDCPRILLCGRRTKRKPLTLHFQAVMREFSPPSLRTLSLGTWFILRKTFYRSIVRPGTESTDFFLSYCLPPQSSTSLHLRGSLSIDLHSPRWQRKVHQSQFLILGLYLPIGCKTVRKVPSSPPVASLLDFSLLGLPSGL